MSELNYARALRIAYQDTGIYPQAIIEADGTGKERTEWQNGWNAYATALNDKTGKILKFYKELPEDLQPVIDKLLADLKLDITEHDGVVGMTVNCNDLFYWACADCEDITLDELPALQQALADSPCCGELLWVCRKRGMRPQKPFYEMFSPEDRVLFDACGPERTDA